MKDWKIVNILPKKCFPKKFWKHAKWLKETEAYSQKSP